LLIAEVIQSIEMAFGWRNPMRAVLKGFGLSAATVAALLFAGCNSSSTPAVSDSSTATKTAEAPPAPVTGKTAYYPLYKSAFSWSPDALVTKIAAKDVTGFKMDAGKAAVWEVTFASPGKHLLRTDTYSITTVLPDIHKGSASGLPLPWGGQTRDAMPVEISSSTVDSDAAYQAAAVDAADFLKKNPGKPLTDFELGATAKLPNPFWYIVWGDSKSGGYVVVVDAVTGKVVKK
jgi:hypothetical protein